MTETSPPLCDYEGSGYRTEFWEGQGRQYEDATERIALRRLLPPKGQRIAHLGAGFGRVTDELGGYKQIVVLDYSRTMLQDAQARLGTSDRYIYVAADIYKLPLMPGSCDAALMERVIHHMADVPAALLQIRSILAPNAVFVLEYASKRNLKAIARYLLRRQDWNPFDLNPVEFVKLNFDFHPKYMAQALREAGFDTERRLALSYFRIGVLKRLIPTSLLVAVDSLLQPSGQLTTYSPSVFTRNRATGDTPPAAIDGPLFKCLHCGSPLTREGDRMVCPNNDGQWAIQDGIYDFKTPLAE